MTLFFVGEIISSELVERKNKNTGEVTMHLAVNTATKIVTRDGKPKIYAEDIIVPVAYKEEIEKNVGKYIMIPHNYIQTKDNAFLFVDEKYQPVILDFNPLLESKKDSTSPKKAA